VRSLLVVGASAGIADPEERARRRAADEALADELEQGGVAAFVTRWMAQPLFASQARLGAAALAEARAQRLANRAHGLANSLRGMGTGAQPALHAALAGLSVPVCFVAGAEDAKFSALAAELAALAPRGRAAVLPGAGHAAHLEAPDPFARLALDFFAEVEAGTFQPTGGNR
jgi:2-succinyl-6-hydroxy-2,4-cyclohexadiene-1-carboxylate synthase